jgi:molybdopterin converting factor subunit 1
MTVTVLYFAGLRQAAGNLQREDYDVVESSTVRQLIDAVIARHPSIQPWRASLLIARNQEWCDADASLSMGDEIALMPPVSGG